MKSTMSNRNIAKFHKLLAQDVSIEKCSKYLGITKAALKKFMPDRMKEVAVDKKAAAEKAAGKVPAAPAKVEAPAKKAAATKE